MSVLNAKAWFHQDRKIQIFIFAQYEDSYFDNYLMFFINFNFEHYQMLQVGSTVENESCNSGLNTQIHENDGSRDGEFHVPP